ncbi:MAG: filamentous hemagglutinin N-terminal domain-containing protein [Opitutaceae bacterium]
MKNRRKLSRQLRRWGGRTAALLLANAPLQAGPSGGQVVSGQASVSVDGPLTTVTAGNNAIVRWNSFDVGRSETVQFVQPGAAARLLNLIGSLSPSQIDGTLRSNGQVYLVNPAGIYFGSSAVVDVGGLYAVGGSIAKEDFLAGLDRFTALSGDVRNEGNLRGESVALIGRAVSNTGSIVSPGGFVGLISGGQVLLRGEGSHILVEAGRTEGREVAPRGVQQSGTIDAGGGSAVLAAGDLYAVAITQSGTIRGSDIRVQGQGGGDVVLTGSLDASTHQPGERGGSVEVTGERVGVLAGSMIDASGPAGGGEIRVGGDFQGANADVRNARVTLVARDALLRADATDAGDGGRVIVWADGSTIFNGTLSAKGAGAQGGGGFAEISGKVHLGFSGTVDLTGSGGRKGELLFDPDSITIQASTPNLNGDKTTGDDITGVGDLNNALLDEPGADSIITAGEVSKLLATSSLTLASTKTIAVNADVSWSSSSALTLTAGSSIDVAAKLTSSGSGSITLNAGSGGIALGADVSSGGTVTLDSAGAISQSAGRVNASILALEGSGSFGTSAASRNTVSTASLLLTKSAGSVFLENQRAGGLSLSGTATGATVNLDSRSATGATTQPVTVGAAGLLAGAATLSGSTVIVAGNLTATVSDVSINAATSVTLTGDVDADDAVSVNFGTAGAGILTLAGSITAPDGFTATGGASGDAIVLNTLAIGTATFDGGGGTDQVTIGGSAGQSISVTGSKAFSIGSLDFTAIEQVAAGGGTDRVDLPNSNSSIVVTGANTVTVQDIDFSQVEAVDAGGGTADTVALTGGDDTFVVTGDNAGSASGIAFSNIEGVDGMAGTDTLTNSSGKAYTVGSNSVAGITYTQFEKLNSPSLKLTAADETIAVTGSGEATIGGVSYSGVTNIDAQGGTDAVTLTAGDDSFSVTGPGKGTGLGITFDNIELIDGGLGIDTLTNATGTALTVGAALPGGLAFANFEKISTPALKLTAGDDVFVVNGNGAGSTGGIEYLGLSTVDAFDGADSVVLTGADDVITYSTAGDVTAAGITFSHIESVDGGGGADSLSLTSGKDEIIATGSLKLSVGTVGFVNVPTVGAGSGTDTLTLTPADVSIAVTGNQSAKILGVTYTGLDAVVAAVGGTDLVTLPGTDDEFSVTGSLAGSSNGIVFSEIESVDGGPGEDTLTNDTGAAFASGSAALGGISFTGFESVDTPILALSNGGETFTLLSAGKGKVGSLTYKGLLSVDALGGTDILELTSGADEVQYDGPGAVTTSGIAFTQFETVKGGGGIDKLTLTKGADQIAVSSTGTVTLSTVTFEAFASVVGGAGGDLVVLTALDDTIQVDGNGAFTTRGIAFTEVESLNAGDGLDTIKLTAGADSVTVDGTNAVTTSGLKIVGIDAVAGGTGADSVKLGSSGELITITAANALSFAGIAFTEFDAVDAAGGIDEVKLTPGADTVTVLGTGSAEVAGITFSQIEIVTGNGGKDKATFSSGDDTLLMASGADVTGNGIRFLNFSDFSGGDGKDTVFLTAASETLTLKGNKEATLAGTLFTDIEGVEAGGGTDSLILTATDDVVSVQDGNRLRAGGIDFGSVELVNGNGGNDALTLTDKADSVTVVGTGAFQYSGIGFSQFASVAGGAGADVVTLSGLSDVLNLSASKIITASGLSFSQFETVDAGAGDDQVVLSPGNNSVNVLGTRSIGVFDITLNNIEKVAGNGGSDSVVLGSGNDLIELLGNNAFGTAGIAFSAFSGLDAGAGQDLVTLSSGNDQIIGLSAGSVSSAGVSFSNIEIVNAGVGADSLTLTGSGDTVAVTGPNGLNALAISFSGIDLVAGGAGYDTILLPGGADAIQLNGPNSVSAAAIQFSEIEAVDAAGGSDTLTLTPGPDTVNLGGTQVTRIANIDFSSIETIAGGGGNDSVTLTAGADAVVVTGKAAFTAANIAFQQFANVNGGLGSDAVTLTEGSDAIIVDGANAVTTSGITFTEIETVHAAGGTDGVTLTSGSDQVDVTGPSQVVTLGILLDGIEQVFGGGGQNEARLSASADVVQVTAAGSFLTSGIAFSEFTAVNGGGGDDELQFTAGADSLVMAGPDLLTSYGLSFTQFPRVDAGGGADTLTLPPSDDQVEVKGPGSLTAGSFRFSQVETVAGGGGVDGVVLGASDDLVTVSGPRAFATSGLAFTAFSTVDGGGGRDTLQLPVASDDLYIDGPKSLRTSDVRFGQFEVVDAGIGGMDRAILTAGDDAVRLLGKQRVSTSELELQGLEVVDGAGGQNALTLLDADDSLTVSDPQAFQTGGIQFSAFTAVAGGGGVDTVVLTDKDETLALNGAKAFSAYQIAFSEFDAVDAGAGSDTILLTAGDDMVTVKGEGSLLTQGIAFTRIESIKGGEGQDLAQLTGEPDAIQYKGGGVFATSGLSFFDFESVHAGGGNDVLTLTPGDDEVALAGPNRLSLDGLSLQDIDTVAGGGGRDRVRLTAGDDSLLVTGASSFETFGMAFSAIAQVDGGEGSDRITLTAGDDRAVIVGERAIDLPGLRLTAVESVDGAAGINQVALTAGDDTVVVDGNRAFSTYGLAFTAMDGVEGGTGVDAVLLTAGDDLLAIRGLNSFSAQSITFREVETVDAGAGFNRLDLTGNDDAVTALDTRRLSTWGLSLSRVDAVDAMGGRDTLTLTPAADTVLVTGVKAATAIAVAFANLETVDAAGGINTVRLTGGDDIVRVLGERSITSSEITFLSVQTIDGSAGVDRIELLPKDDVVTLAGPGRVLVDDLTLASFEAIDGAGGANTLQGTAAAESWTIDGVNRGSVQGVAFDQFATLKTGGSATDTFTFTSGSGDVTGKIAGEGATVVLENATDSLVTLSGPLIAPSVRFGATGSGGFRVTNPANEVTTIAAALGGTLVFRNNGGFSIGRVEGLAGLKVGGDLRLEADGGELLIEEPVSTGRNATVKAARVQQSNRVEVGVVDAQGTLDVEALAGSITFAADAVSRAAGGTIRYAATADIVAGELDAGSGSISLVAGGGILDANAAAINLRGSAARVQAGTGSIGSATNALETDLARLATSSGESVFVAETSDLDFGTSGPLVVQRVGEDGALTAVSDVSLSPQPVPGDLQIAARGSLTVSGAASGVLQAQGQVVLMAGEGDLSVTPALVSGENVVLVAGGTVRTRADVTAKGTLDIEATTGSFASDPGTLLSASKARIATGADLSISQLQADTVSLVAGGTIADGASATAVPSITATEVRLEAGTSIGSGENRLNLATQRLAAKAGAGLYLEEKDGVSVTQIPDQTWSRAVAGQGTITITDASLSGLAATGDLRFATGATSAGTFAVERSVKAGGSVLLAAGAGDLTLNAPVTAGSDLSVVATGTVSQASALTAGGTLDVASRGASVLMAPGSTGATSGGDIRYEAAEGLQVGELSAGTGAILARAGKSISDANGDALNFSASRVRLVATQGSIGSVGDRVDLAVQRVEAVAGGSLYLFEKDAVTVGSVGAISVNRTLIEGGKQTLADQSDRGGLSSTGSDTGRVIALTTREGSVTLAPGSTVTTGATVAQGPMVLGSGTTVEPGAVAAGSMTLKSVRLAGDLQSAGALDLQGVTVQSDANGRGRIEVAAGTQVVLSGAERASYGSNTVVLAPLAGVSRVEADQNVRIAAPIQGTDLVVTADADGATRTQEAGPGGVRIESSGSLTSAGNLTVTGAAWSGPGATGTTGPLAIEVLPGGRIQATGAVSLSASSQAPAGSSLLVAGGTGTASPAVGSSAGTISLGAAPGGVVVLAGSDAKTPLVSAANALTFRSPVEISGPTLIESTRAGDLVFSSSVDGQTGTSADVILRTDGLTRLGGAVGDRVPLGSLTTSPQGGTELGSGRVRVTGNLTFGDSVTLLTDSTLAAGSLTFGSSVVAGKDGGAALNLAVSGETQFLGSVGDGGRRLSSLATDAGGSTRFSGDRVVTVGAQTYADPVLLGGKTEVVGSAVTFQNTLDSAPSVTGSLQVTSPGTVSFLAPVGQLRRIGTLSTDAGGATSVRANVTATSLDFADDVTFEGAPALVAATTGDQRYARTLTLGSDLSLTSTTGNITLGLGAQGGGRSLTGSAGNGLISAVGDLGGVAARLKTVQLSGRDLLVNNVWTTDTLALEIGKGTGSGAAANPYLEIRGSVLDSETGSVVLGSGALTPADASDDKTTPPLRSSIFKANTGDLLIAGTNVTLQPFERLAVRDGNLVIFADQVMTLSNTAASQTLALIAPQIRLRSRAPAPALFGDSQEDDRGMDLVAGRVLFFRGGALDAPTRADLGKLDLGKSQGTLLVNSPEVITLIAGQGQTPQTVLVADLAEERSVLRPLVANLVYLDLTAASGVGNVTAIPPSRFGSERESPLFAVTANGQLRASLEQVYVPVAPRQEQAMEPAEADLAPALREQLQALGIYSRALMRYEEQARSRRAGTFVVVPNRIRPFESDYEVVDARVEGASVREVLRLAAETGLVGEQTAELSSVADALATAYDAFFKESQSEDGRTFRSWLEKRRDTESRAVLTFVRSLKATLVQIERLGLTRHELEVSKSQIYGNLLRPRLNADADFLRLLVEGDLDEPVKPATNAALPGAPERPLS